MHFVCKNCFADKELLGLIISQGTIGVCDCCKSNAIEVIEIKELFEFFNELFLNFQSKDDGQTLISIIQGNWSLFNDISHGNKILNYVLNELNTQFKNAAEVVGFSDEILENVNHWFKLKEQLKWERRYFINIEYLTEDLGWDGFFESKTKIKNEDLFYRARLHKNANQRQYKSEEMLCPPKEISTAGRANPIGIPYLYLCDNEETILYEIRASYLDEASVASFSLNKGVSQDILISDFTEVPALYVPGEVNKRIKSTLLKQIISRDLSKPMRRYDSELDYIPTQFICEFIKIFTDVKGIKFRSSIHNIGNNIVIFNQDLMACNSIKKVRISNVNIKSIDLK